MRAGRVRWRVSPLQVQAQSRTHFHGDDDGENSADPTHHGSDPPDEERVEQVHGKQVREQVVWER